MNYQDKTMSLLIKHEKTILAIIILIGLAIRLYGITLPLVESHQVRQAQTAMMARNLFEDNFNIFRTRLDFFGNVPGYIVMEFPLMHAITALLYIFFGVHEILGRLVSVAFSMGSMLLIYGLARHFLLKAGAFAALLLYALSPMNIFFSRAFMPESSMIFFITGAVYFFLNWLNKRTAPLYVIAVIFAACACLTKPTAVLIFAPILAAWFFKDKWRIFSRYEFWLYIFLTTLPFILWAAYAYMFNSQIRYCTWGFSANWGEIARTRGGIIAHWIDPKFYLFLGGSIVFLLLTPLGFICSVTGILFARKGYVRTVLSAWLGALVFYFYALSGPNSGHVYYHLLLLPPAAVLCGLGVEWFLGRTQFIKALVRKKTLALLGGILIGLILLGYVLGYHKFFKYMYRDTMPYVLEVSEIIKKNVPENRFVLDNESGLLTSVISYYSHSKTRVFILNNSSISELEELRGLGATTFVAMETAYGGCVRSTQADTEFWRYLNDKYKPVAITDHYFIFDLRVP